MAWSHDNSSVVIRYGGVNVQASELEQIPGHIGQEISSSLLDSALVSAIQGLTNAVVTPCQVLLVSSSRHPDQWIVPGGGMEPEEEPCGAAVREVFEEVCACSV